MQIKTVHTEFLIEEINTDGHAPLKFVCDDGNIYYCKYLNSFKKEEIDCLAYEVVANYLLSYLNIPTPEIALVKITPGTLNQDKIKANRRLRENYVCFGSKEIKFSQEIQSIQTFTKRDFKKLLNPEDIIKIAFFDLWVDNVDRGRHFDGGINYNLLLKAVGKKQKTVAFDNAFIFGGTNEIGVFTSTSSVSRHNKLVGSPYYKNTIDHFDFHKTKNIVDKFVPLLIDFQRDTVQDIIKELTEYWELSPNLDKRIIRFLSDEKRIKQCELTILKSKK